MTKVPDWMIDYVQEARRLFGLGGAEWNISVRLSDKPIGDPANDGGVNVDCVYMNADIEMKHQKNSQMARANIYHEVLHILHDPVDRLVMKAIERLPREEAKIFKDLYLESIERYTQVLSRSIVNNLEKPNGSN